MAAFGGHEHCCSSFGGTYSDSLHSSSSRPSLHCSSGSLGSGPHSDPLRECHAASQDSVAPTELDSDNDDSQMPSPTAAALASSTACQAASGATTSNGEGATTSNGEGATTSAAASSTAVIGSDAEGATTSNPPPSLQPSESQTIAEDTCPVADNNPYLELLEPTHGENRGYFRRNLRRTSCPMQIWYLLILALRYLLI